MVFGIFHFLIYIKNNFFKIDMVKIQIYFAINESTNQQFWIVVIDNDGLL
jgi:hypothetical protein